MYGRMRYMVFKKTHTYFGITTELILVVTVINR